MKLSAVAGALVLLLAGCGAQGGSATSAPPPAADGAFPVSIPGKLGTATIPERPARVVAMSWTDGDIALSLGVVPVGMGRVDTSPSGFEPWTEQAVGGAPRPAGLDTTQGDPVEQIAALEPDVILATKDYRLGERHSRLSQIAPVVGYLDGPNSDTWQESTTAIGRALGLPDEAARVIAGTEGAIADAARAHPEFAGKTFSLLVSPSETGVYTVNSTADVSSTFLSQLGLTLTPAVTGLQTSRIPGRAQLSWERIATAQADVVFATGSPTGLGLLAGNPAFVATGATRDGRYVPLEPALAQSIAFPSPISIRWGVDALTPRISAALRGAA